MKLTTDLQERQIKFKIPLTVNIKDYINNFFLAKKSLDKGKFVHPKSLVKLFATIVNQIEIKNRLQLEYICKYICQTMNLYELYNVTVYDKTQSFLININKLIELCETELSERYEFDLIWETYEIIICKNINNTKEEKLSIVALINLANILKEIKEFYLAANKTLGDYIYREHKYWLEWKDIGWAETLTEYGVEIIHKINEKPKKSWFNRKLGKSEMVDFNVDVLPHNTSIELSSSFKLLKKSSIDIHTWSHFLRTKSTHVVYYFNKQFMNVRTFYCTDILLFLKYLSVILDAMYRLCSQNKNKLHDVSKLMTKHLEELTDLLNLIPIVNLIHPDSFSYLNYILKKFIIEIINKNEQKYRSIFPQNLMNITDKFSTTIYHMCYLTKCSKFNVVLLVGVVETYCYNDDKAMLLNNRVQLVPDQVRTAHNAAWKNKMTTYKNIDEILNHKTDDICNICIDDISDFSPDEIGTLTSCRHLHCMRCLQLHFSPLTLSTR